MTNPNPATNIAARLAECERLLALVPEVRAERARTRAAAERDERTRVLAIDDVAERAIAIAAMATDQRQLVLRDLGLHAAADLIVRATGAVREVIAYDAPADAATLARAVIEDRVPRHTRVTVAPGATYSARPHPLNLDQVHQLESAKLDREWISVQSDGRTTSKMLRAIQVDADGWYVHEHDLATLRNVSPSLESAIASGLLVGESLGASFDRKRFAAINRLA